MRASDSNRRRTLAFAEYRRIHPCFKCHGIAVRKIEFTSGSRILNRQMSLAVDSYGHVVLSHRGKLWRPWPSLITLHVALGLELSRLFSLEVPLGGRRADVACGQYDSYQ